MSRHRLTGPPEQLRSGWRAWFYRGTHRTPPWQHVGHLATGTALYISVHTR